jgi:hypothetical protein
MPGVTQLSVSACTYLPQETLAFIRHVTLSLFRQIKESRIFKNFGGHLQKANTDKPGIRRGSQTLFGDQSHQPVFLLELLLALKKLYLPYIMPLFGNEEHPNLVARPFGFWPLTCFERYGV